MTTSRRPPSAALPSQPDLFGEVEALAPASPAPSPAGGGQALVRIDAPAATLGKSQREFNRLTERIERLRADLAAWRAARDRAQARQAAEVAPLHAQLTALQRDVLLWIDAFLTAPPVRGERRLGKLQRRKLVWMLQLLANAVLQGGDDAEVEAAHDRHASQTRREERREQADLAAAVLGAAVGDERLFEGPADSVEELLERATQRMQQAHAEAGADDDVAAAAQRPSRGQRARARDAQALEEASRSVREVFRRLASSLHPDRELDPQERSRKTALMVRVNEAYARNDLLDLLTVQMAIEQIDAEHLRAVPETQLRHYLRVLKEQERSLQEEIDWMRMPLIEALDRRPGSRLTPQGYDRMVEQDLQELRDVIRQLGSDAALLRDVGTRRAFLNALEIDDPDEGLDPFEALLLEQAFVEAMAPPQAPAGRRRR